MIMFDILKCKNIVQIERALINHLTVAKQFFSFCQMKVWV